LENIKNRVGEYDEEILFADGFEDALIGIAYQFGSPGVACYDWDKCLEKLQTDGMTPEEAEEFFEFNVIGAYIGEYTPVFVKDMRWIL
jgi:hypothetical protein